MPFWLNDNKFTVYVQRISTLSRVGISVIILSLFFIGYFVISFFPKRKMIKNQVHSNSHIKKQNTIFTQTIQSLDGIKNRHVKMLKNVKTVQASYWSDQKTMEEVLQLLKKYKLQCRQFQPSYIKKKKFFSKEYVDLTIRGAFRDMVVFLQELKKIKHPVHIASLTMPRSRGNNVSLSLTLRLCGIRGGETV